MKRIFCVGVLLIVLGGCHGFGLHVVEMRQSWELQTPSRRYQYRAHYSPYGVYKHHYGQSWVYPCEKLYDRVEQWSFNKKVTDWKSVATHCQWGTGIPIEALPGGATIIKVR